MMIKFLAVIAFTLVLSVNPAFADNGKILNVQKLTTSKGIEIVYVHDETVPIVSMTFSFSGGLDLDPIDKPGIGKMVSILLDEGAGDLDSEQFQKILNDNSIEMSFTAGRDDFVGNLKTLTYNQDKAFSLLKMALTSPKFDEDAITRMKNANIASIKNDMSNPSWLVSRTFNGMIFEGHNYANPGAGNISSVSAITRDDLVNFTKKQFALDKLKVAIVGFISADDAKKMVDSTFSDLPATSDKIETTNATLAYKGKTILLPLDIPQTFISVGEQGIAINDPLWPAAQVMNFILGGGSFDARLMSEIREKRGLTYGVYSDISNMKHADLIRASLSTKNESAADALLLLKKEWRRMKDFGVTDIELANAKAYLTGSLPLNLTSTDDISGILNSQQNDGFDYNYINRRNELINQVTLKDVKAAAEKLLDENNLTVVIVGKPAGITADITLQQPPKMGD